MSEPIYAIPYYRVSTSKQEESGLSLEGQQRAVAALCEEKGWEVYQEFVDIESGKGSRTKFRTQVLAALDLAKELDPNGKGRAVLIVYKLDRLGRNVHFLTGVRDSGVQMYIMEMPNVSRLEFNIRAVVAEEEVEQISKRTIFALDVLKQKGVPLGTHNKKVYAGVQKCQERSRKWLASLRPILERYLKADFRVNDIVDALNESGVPTARGRYKWTRQNLYRVLNALDLKKRDFKKRQAKQAA
ncbi:recombinase family protein [Endozoicomonas lisbonensis]|uniref:DNA invertase Pin-like site-specific DNA recombinase n=1 Tax=Endozoicomonas lisbonensis TaxID=3120522 RepID=A0ABV2SPA8_9GAMM